MKKPVIFDKKHVGDIINNVFVSTREYEKHFFRIFNGWGESIKILNFLESININDILIICDGKSYVTNVDCFFVHGVQYNNPLMIGDKQLILPLKFWHEGIIKFEQELITKHLNTSSSSI